MELLQKQGSNSCCGFSQQETAAEKVSAGCWMGDEEAEKPGLAGMPVPVFGIRFSMAWT
jgi:hypothetical protein